jgi:CheY-like chemotaxis protein
MNNYSRLPKTSWEIAIVDDSLDYCDFLEATILAVTPGSKTTCFRTGEELLEQIEQKGFRPDIIFLDWSLPALTGKEVLDRIKKSPSKLTTVFVVTSSAMTVDIHQAYASHCSLYFLKPSEPEELYKLLSELFMLIRNKFTLLAPGGE